ncbi:TMhelix containing protein [Vibrio phage 1.208.B._10N.222.52.A7]|nr:TMhelix containing protein [Vibrio phage 1.208.B._10N.222.52.A7]
MVAFLVSGGCMNYFVGTTMVGLMQKGDIFKARYALVRVKHLTKSRRFVMCETVCCGSPMSVRAEEFHTLRDINGTPLNRMIH